MRYLFTLLSFLPALAANATADGPDYFQISGATSAQMFKEKSQQAPLVLLVPPGTNGIKNLGCEGAPTYTDWQKMNQKEQLAASQSIWCKVSINSREGWIQNSFLVEGSDVKEAPTFDCSAPRPHEAEILICGDRQLALLDQQMAAVFHAARAKAMHDGTDDNGAANNLIAHQRGWIKGRNECWKEQKDKKGCIVKAYHRRIAFLQIYWRLISKNKTVNYACDSQNHEHFTATFYNDSVIPGVWIDYKEQNDVLLYEGSERYVARNEKQLIINGTSSSFSWTGTGSEMQCDELK